MKMNMENPELQNENDFMGAIAIICLFGVYMILSVFLLNGIQNEKIPKKLSWRMTNLHRGIKTARRFAIYFYPGMILRRFVFCIIPTVLLPNIPGLQLTALLCL